MSEIHEISWAIQASESLLVQISCEKIRIFNWTSFIIAILAIIMLFLQLHGLVALKPLSLRSELRDLVPGWDVVIPVYGQSWNWCANLAYHLWWDRIFTSMRWVTKLQPGTCRTFHLKITFLLSHEYHVAFHFHDLSIPSHALNRPDVISNRLFDPLVSAIPTVH